jgi:hypothetical protein
VVLLHAAPITETLIEQRGRGDDRLAAGDRLCDDAVRHEALDLLDLFGGATQGNLPAQRLCIERTVIEDLEVALAGSAHAGDERERRFRQRLNTIVRA